MRVARARDARACLSIIAEGARERPRTLAVLEHELWSPRVWRRNRLDWGDRGVSLVAELEGRIVGELSAARGARAAHRHEANFGITVASAARGQGVGGALLAALEEWARAHGIDRISLSVFRGNERALALYRGLGYVEEGVDRRGARFPESDVDVIRMAKLLDAPGARAAGAAGYDERRERAEGVDGDG